MPEINLREVLVRFPFEPYEVQKTYMTKVIECLQNSTNGILESPTGTGKTLCLLCSTMGWLETIKARYSAMKQGTTDSSASLSAQMAGAVGNSWIESRFAPPKIIYSSRTHSQLSQAVNELKRTTYKYMKVSVVGSRDQMCVHPEVSKETNNNSKVYMCQLRVKAKTCHYYNQVEHKKDNFEVCNNIKDIEDLVDMGKKMSFCPYYMSRELKKDVDIIFMPYNYLLDPKTRKAHGVEIEGNIIIFDEAHNIEKMCEEAASHQFTSTDLALCVDEVTQVMKKFEENSDANAAAAFMDSQGLDDFSPEDLCTLKTIFLELEKAIDSIPLPADGSGATHPGGYIFDLLEKADITPGKKTVIIELLEKLIQFLTANSSSPFQRKGAGLQKFLDLIHTVFSRDHFSKEQMDFMKSSYKVHVSVEEPKKKAGPQDGWNAPKTKTISSKTGRVISYWCFHPGFGMQSLVEQGAKCVILTSGTLSPLDSFTSELQVPFPVQLENPHIIQRNQVWAGVICNGPDGMTLNSSYKNRSDPRYKKSLGQTILNLSRIIPAGLLIFFPSYTVMNDCQEEWQKSGVWSKLSELKPVFVEPKNKEDFHAAMKEYYEKINNPAYMGACFMAVCRGKVSEGLDFADRNGRAVIITGLPYPPFKEPRVVHKQKYLDEARTKRKHGLSGQAWYNLEASRAVNQAVGRVIRHKDDFGAIIFCDNRCATNHFMNQLSAWIRPYIVKYDKFGFVIRDISQFFKHAKIVEKRAPSLSIKQEEVTQSKPSSSYPVPSRGLEVLTTRPIPSQNLKRYRESHSTASNEDDEVTILDTYEPHQTTPQEPEKPAKMNLSIFDILNQEVPEKRAPLPPPSPPRPKTNYQARAMETKRRKIKLVPRPMLFEESEETPDARKELSTISDVPAGCSKEGKQREPCHDIEHKYNVLKGVLQSKEDKDRKLKATGAYIMEVKAALTKEKYAVFSSAVKEYKSKSNLENLFKVIPEIFSGDKCEQELMRKFQTFLKADDRKKFEAFIQDRRRDENH